MHEAGGADIPALLLAIILVAVVSLGIYYQTRASVSRRVEVLKLQRFAAADAARDEGATAKEYTSMLAASAILTNGTKFGNDGSQERHATSSTDNSRAAHYPYTNANPSTSSDCCAVCSRRTSRQCSRCKAVRYCCAECQIQHWRGGHHLVCRAPEVPSGNKSLPISRSENSISTTRNLFGHSSRINEKSSYKTSRSLASKPHKTLFPYEYFEELFYWGGVDLSPCGLINCGNSCFANVVLQCLTYTRPLTAYLLQGSHTKECRRNDWCFMCELQCHVIKVKESRNPFSPIRILSKIRNIGNHLGYGRQEDAHEFMRFAIDSMQSICLDEVGGEKVVDLQTQETTFIQHVFGGHLQSQVKCMQCHHESDRYENMMDLAVEIQGNVESLEDALAQFTAPEWLDGENKYKCDRCNAYVKARKRLTVHDAPNILTIALKRFQGGKFGKLNKRVSFPEVLDISPYMSGKYDKLSDYRLYGVVVHVDLLNASFFGHYICYVKDLHGSWYKIDDSKVKEVNLQKVMQQSAYMLLYTRSAPRPAPIMKDEALEPNVAANINGYSIPGRTVLPNGNPVQGLALPKSSDLLNGVSSTNGCITSSIGDNNDACSQCENQCLREANCSSSQITPCSTELNLISVDSQDLLQKNCHAFTRASSSSQGSSFTSDRDGMKILPIAKSLSSDFIEVDLNEVMPALGKSGDGGYNLQSQPTASMQRKTGEVLDIELSPLATPRPVDIDQLQSCIPTGHGASSTCPALLNSFSEHICSSLLLGDNSELESKRSEHEVGAMSVYPLCDFGILKRKDSCVNDACEPEMVSFSKAYVKEQSTDRSIYRSISTYDGSDSGDISRPFEEVDLGVDIGESVSGMPEESKVPHTVARSGIEYCNDYLSLYKNHGCRTALQQLYTIQPQQVEPVENGKQSNFTAVCFERHELDMPEPVCGLMGESEQDELSIRSEAVSGKKMVSAVAIDTDMEYTISAEPSPSECSGLMTESFAISDASLEKPSIFNSDVPSLPQKKELGSLSMPPTSISVGIEGPISLGPLLNGVEPCIHKDHYLHKHGMPKQTDCLISEKQVSKTKSILRPGFLNKPSRQNSNPRLHDTVDVVANGSCLSNGGPFFTKEKPSSNTCLIVGKDDLEEVALINKVFSMSEDRKLQGIKNATALSQNVMPHSEDGFLEDLGKCDVTNGMLRITANDTYLTFSDRKRGLVHTASSESLGDGSAKSFKDCHTKDEGNGNE